MPLMHIAAKVGAEKLCWACRGLKRALQEVNSGSGRALTGPQQSTPAVLKQLPARSSTNAPADPAPDTENQQPASSQVHTRHATQLFSAYACP